MTKPSLTNFYNLVQNYTAGKLAKLSLLPVLMLLMSISAFSQTTQTYTCDDDCEGFLQVEICIEINAPSPPIYLSSSDNLFYKPLSAGCPVPLDSWGTDETVFVNTTGSTYCYEDLYIAYGATTQYTITNGPNFADIGSFTAPDAPSLSITGPAEACLGNEGDAVFVPTITVEAPAGDPNAVTIDPAATWIGFMNVFELDGTYVFGNPWGVDDLVTSFSGDELCFQPNQIDDPSSFWYTPMGGPGSMGNKIMEALHYVQEDGGIYNGMTLSYSVEVTSIDFSCGHTTEIFIREFAPDFSSFTDNAIPISGPGIYTVTLPISTTAGNHVQYGQATTGVNVWATDAAACGSVKMQPTTPLLGESGTWSVQDAAGVQVETGVAVHNQESSFTFAGEGDYTVELLYETADGCVLSTSTPITVLDPSSASLDGDTYVCDTDLPSAYFLDFEGDLDCTPVWTLTDADGMDVSALLVAVGGEAYQISVNWPAGAEDASPYELTLECSGGTCNASPDPIEITFSDGTANQLACNNLVNITLNANCELILTPDMILEGSNNEDQYSVVVTDIETGEELPDVLDYSHVGNTYQVMVVEDCSNNSCWGYIKVEDKGIPQLECPEDVIVSCDEIDDLAVTGLPVFDADVTLTLTSSDPVQFNVAGFDNCTDATLTFTDAITDESCVDGEPGTTITRTFTITDQVGHSSSCSQMIEVIRPEVSSITAPPAYSNSIAGAEPAIDLCDVTDGLIALDDNGNPDPSVTGYPTGLTCMNVSINGYDDVIELPLCGPGSGAKKIIREWQIFEACTGDITTLTQIIEIADDAPPVTVCPADNIEIPADPYDCGTEVELFPYPGSGGFGEIVELIECSDFTFEVFYKPAIPGTLEQGDDPFTSIGVVTGPDDSVIVPATEGLRVWITYVIEDACGNTAIAQDINSGAGEIGADQVSCFFEVDYIDVTPPQPVCDLYSVVSVGSDGCTLVGPQSFNDGSHDNCSEELTFEVQRMDDFTGSNYQEYVEFCCEDVSNSPIMVILNVTDEDGNAASCMVEVTVNDNISPVLQNCPSNETVDCEDPRLNTLAAFGAPSFTDNCSGTLSMNPTQTNIDDCGFGTITRSWSLVDAGGNSGGTCTQTITVVNSSPFAVSNIDWPEDTTIDCNDSSDPSDTGEPTVDDIGCSNVLFSFDDMDFESLSGNTYCQKILRHWSVIDWCNQGQTFTYTQVIRVEDNGIPAVSCPGVDTSGDLNPGSCTKTVELVASGFDNCTASEDLVWFYTVDLDNDGSVNFSRPGSDATGSYPVGNHVVTFFAEDECSNVGSCSVTVNIDDDILPTPYCLSEVVTVLSVATGQAEIWAEDLNAGSFDNCFDGSASDVEISFAPTPGDLVRFFDCDDIANGIVDTVSLNVYVIDEDGNSDFCTAMVIIQDNNDLCPDMPTDEGGDDGDPADEEEEEEEEEGDNDNGRISIRGEVATEGAAMLSDIMVRLQSNQPEFPIELATDASGYEFADLTADESYMVQAENNDNHSNGVSTLDIILIQRHILNIQDLDSPYKLIAADANNSGDVSAADMVDIRKLILEIYSEYPSNTSWRFVNRDFVFADATQPFPYEEDVNLVNQGTDASVNFIGVKVGDVNQSVTINGVTSESVDTRGSKSLKLETAVRAGANGQSLIDVIVTETSDVYGFQFALDANANVSDILSGTLQINDNNINMTQSDRGLAMLSWNSTSLETLNAGDVIFTIEADANSTGLDVDATLMNPEAYVLGDNDGIDITTVTIGASQAEAINFAVYQNKPNPFSELTTIGFTLPQTQSVTLKVMDVTGQVLYSLTDTYSKGTNEVLFDASLVNTTGILYYQIETDTHSSTKKMVILK